jgi:hypothetical protein
VSISPLVDLSFNIQLNKSEAVIFQANFDINHLVQHFHHSIFSLDETIGLVANVGHSVFFLLGENEYEERLLLLFSIFIASTSILYDFVQ